MTATAKNITTGEAMQIKGSLEPGQKLLKRRYVNLALVFNASKETDQLEKSRWWVKALEIDDRAIADDEKRTFYTLVTGMKQKPARKYHIYRHYDKDGVLLYVGMSNNALSRLSQHKQHADWFEQIETVKIQTVNSRSEAFRLERKAIAEEKPKFNISAGNHGSSRCNYE